MNGSLTDKVTIVAGNAEQITADVVRSFLLEGATVIFPAKSAHEITTLNDRLGDLAKGRLVTLLTDYPDYYKAFEVAETMMEQFGKIDIAVICYATPNAPDRIVQTDIRDWEKMIEHNITAYFVSARIILDCMRKNKEGMFVSISKECKEAQKPPCALASLSGMMQQEMAKMFSTEFKKEELKCYHLFLRTKEADGPGLAAGCVNENAIGTYIIQLYQGEVQNSGNLFQELAYD